MWRLKCKASMKFILGQKLEMSQIFQDDGNVVPVSIVQAGPCVVAQIKTKDKDGYEAVQIGFGRKKQLTKPELGHLKKLGKFRWLKEFKRQNKKKPAAIGDYKIGDKVEVSMFQIGDMVQASGISKGKGFQGVVKRHGFHGSPASHGHKDQLRMPGSIGATDPGRVFKGKRMAGQMGNKRITVKGLEVIQVDKKKNLLYIKGAVPGARGTLLEISTIYQ